MSIVLFSVVSCTASFQHYILIFISISYNFITSLIYISTWWLTFIRKSSSAF
ncbi:hypothetical protein [Chryseobacterium takakiae]|uniref:hypothetical protein n=1 Tax=Chryseobacterium takakiae TaxID=1302685 RepID=UPI0015B6BD78|nr:hypothetical protein [Chryseobacterium takakiae]